MFSYWTCGILVACILFLCQYIAVHGLAYTPSDILWNRCPSQDRIYAKLHNHTLDTCVVQCRDQADCWAAMYNRISAVCFLVRDDASVALGLHKCQGYALVEKGRMQTGSPNDEYTGHQICPRVALIQSHNGCSILGNVETPGGKTRLGCTIPSHLCEVSTFVCGQNGLWTFEKCLQKMILNAKLVSGNPAGGYTNFALNAFVAMSSQYNDRSPGTLLVDGDRDPIWPCACTLNETHPSMVVDFGQPRTISHMFIVNRRDCCSERLHNVRILIGTDMANLRQAIYIPGRFGQTGIIELAEPVTARYVKITITGTQILTICEFEAWLEATPSPP